MSTLDPRRATLKAIATALESSFVDADLPFLLHVEGQEDVWLAQSSECCVSLLLASHDHEKVSGFSVFSCEAARFLAAQLTNWADAREAQEEAQAEHEAS